MSSITSSKTSSTTRRVARAATIVMLAFVVSRVLGLVREAVIGARFGAMDEYGAYLAAFRIPDLIFNLIAGGALASAFLPTYTLFLTRDEHENGWRLASAVANWLMIGLGVVSVLAAIFAPWLVANFIAPGFEPELVELTAQLMRYMLISTVIFSLSGLMMSILNAHEHFLMPAIAPVMYNVGILFGALVLVPYVGIFGLAWGVVLGAAGHAVVQLPKLRAYGARYMPTLGRRDPTIRSSVGQVGKLMGPRVLGAAVVQLMFLANTIIASFYDPSILAALNYAWIVMLLPNGVFASSIATAIFPTFSRMAAVGDKAGMRQGLAQTLRALLFVVVPSAVGLVMLRVPIIQLLFERGQFTHETTMAVAWALGFYGFGLIGHALIEIISRAYFAIQDTFTPVAIGVLAMATNIGLSLLLIPVIGDATSFTTGPQGALALANTIASTAEVFVLLWFLRPKIGGIEALNLLNTTVRLAIAATVMGGALWLMPQLPILRDLPILIFTPLAIAVGGAIYFIYTLVLGVEEAEIVPNMILRRRKGARGSAK
ncbi:MAG: murein biosynthesis integral membrane protein MurJ [Ardenticatenaceae bacterium]